MELVELQAIWQQYDKKLSDNTRLNKEILKRILISKPEKRLTWLKIKAISNLILPIVLILLVLVPNIRFRDSIDFIIGFLLFGIVAILLYYWSFSYYLLIKKINFANSVTLLKKNMYQLEKYKIKLTRLSYIIMPFGIAGIFLMGKFPIQSMSSLLPISLIILVTVSYTHLTLPTNREV